jgi:hypothetical protein
MATKRNSKGQILKGQPIEGLTTPHARGNAKKVKNLPVPACADVELDNDDASSAYKYLLERTDYGKSLIDWGVAALQDKVEEAHLEQKLTDAQKQKVWEKMFEKVVIPPRPEIEDAAKDEMSNAIEAVHKRIKARSSKPAGPGRGHKKVVEDEDGEDETEEATS